MAKANNRIVELAGDALPLFADPGRDYDYVTQVEGFRRIKGGARFTVITSEGHKRLLDVLFVLPDILRFRFYAAGEEPPLTSPMLVERDRPPVDIAVESTPDKVILRGPSIALHVVRRPFHFGVFDGNGRKLFVQQIGDVSFRDIITYPMGFSQDAGGRIACHEGFEIDPDEHFYGLGQQYGALDKRGQRIVAWTRDAMGVNTTNVTYHNIPFFMSSRGYGILVHHSSKITCELGFPSTVSGAFRVDDPYLDYFFVNGPRPKDVLARYAELTGDAPKPPLWSFGVWLSRCFYTNRQQVEEVVEKAREIGFPADVVHLDPLWLKDRRQHRRDACHFAWDDGAFPGEEEFVDWLRERGARLCLWENPYVWKDCDMYREGVEKGYFALGPDGQPIGSLENENPDEPENVVIDFTNPKAARWWSEKHLPHLRKGIATFKTDYGEGVPLNARFSDGRTGAQVHNIYPLLYNRAVFETIRRERGDDALVWARSGWAGSQRYPLHWVGDTQCTFGGMAGALRAGLSLSLSGIPFWSHDIGGFFNPDRVQRPDPTLYIRWAQWGLLSSHSRFHGVREREPWFYGDEALRIVTDFAKLRYSLLPYLWACAQEASETLVPVCRPMCLEFPDDPLTAALDRQYMLGPSLLVAPVFNAEGKCNVYLPAGRWFDFWSGAAVDGGRLLELTVPIDRIPLYVCGDSILPFGEDRDYVEQKPWDKLRLDIRVDTAASLRIPAPIGPVEMKARKTRNGVQIDLKATGRQLQLRLLEPSTARDVAFSGDVQGERWRRTRNGPIIDLTVNGRARIHIT